MKPSRKIQGIFLTLALPILVIAGLLGALLQWSLDNSTLMPVGAQHTDSMPTLTATLDDAISIPVATEAEPTSFVPPVIISETSYDGVLLLALQDGANIHLFAWSPDLPLTRITRSPWDEQNPCLSPDGMRLAYVSGENGYDDLFVRDLTTGVATRITDSAEAEANPSWSPDGQYVAYQRFDGTNSDIYLLSLAEASAEPIRLTDARGVDSHPSWSPQGRLIAFASDRSGDEEIWLADLDKVDERFSNLSNNPKSQDHAPIWSADGTKLAWAAESDGERRIAVWRSNQPDWLAAPIGIGDQAAWNEDGSQIWSEVKAPNQASLIRIATEGMHASRAALVLPGESSGFTWVSAPLPNWLAAQITLGDTAPPPQPAPQALSHLPVVPVGRQALAALDDVTAPQAYLHDATDEAFVALRQQISASAGWDALSSLENAFIPITTPNNPMLQQDWLYTGRAFALNPLLMSAGWMTIGKETFDGETYWRVYLRTRYQDGSMGEPITRMVWDLNARYSGDPQAYEQGGKLAPAPAGYWIDLTRMAQQNGWERLPSLNNWKTYYPSIHYNQFVMTEGLDWYSAMRELYPIEALITPTPLPSPTMTPTATIESAWRRATRTPTPTKPPTATLVPTQTTTRRPTWTPPSQSQP